jgi:hypothetical protein
MPSYIAWGTAILASIVGKLFALPLGLLQVFLPFPVVFQSAFPSLRSIFEMS